MCVPAAETLVFKEPMITAGDLLKRWTGIKQYELKKIIGEKRIEVDELGNAVVPRPHVSGLILGDPLWRITYKIHPYCIDKVLEDENGEHIYYCRLANWVTVEDVLRGANYGYHVGFKIAEVEDYEQKHPEVLYQIVECPSSAPVVTPVTTQTPLQPPAEPTQETPPPTLQEVGEKLGYLAIGAAYVSGELNKGFHTALTRYRAATTQKAVTNINVPPRIPAEPVAVDTPQQPAASPLPQTSADAATPLPQSCGSPTHETCQGQIASTITAWEAVLPSLRGAELTAAKLAINKWRGKSHAEAYKAAISDGCASNPKAFVSKMKRVAQKVAHDHGLPMPVWQSKAQ